ncbi:MAG TPA: hypothetical protein VF201_03760 [Nitrolancea sp.]
MAQTLPIRLSADEIIRQAKLYFGDIGMLLERDGTTDLRFTGDDGFVELEVRPDDERQVRLLIEEQGYDAAIRGFRRLLAHESRPGRAALPGQHFLPRQHYR